MSDKKKTVQKAAHTGGVKKIGHWLSALWSFIITSGAIAEYWLPLRP